MAETFNSFEALTTIKSLCRKIMLNQKDRQSMLEMKEIIVNSSSSFVNVVQPVILSTLYPIFKAVAENKSSFTSDEKHLVVDVLKSVFEKGSIDKIALFFNIYAFLLFEVYDHITHKILGIDEEYKLSIMQCMIMVSKSLNSDLITVLYVKENATKLCQMLFVAIELAVKEQLRPLRIAAIKCIMSIARVLDDNDFKDEVIRDQIAELFLFFLPGVSSGLIKVALEEEKVGHKVPMIALRAWGRIVTLLMQDYNAADEKIDIKYIKKMALNPLVGEDKNEMKTKWKNENEIKDYLKKTNRTVQWYKETDKKLHRFIRELTKLTHHSHENVRLELSEMASLVMENCASTMPTSVCHLMEILIILSEDNCEAVSKNSNKILNDLSQRLDSHRFKILLENLEEGFYIGITSLQCKFNGIDEREQLAALNLIIGYIRLFGQHNLTQLLISANYLSSLMVTLIQISCLEKNNVSLLVEYTIQEFDLSTDMRMPWKQFRHFKEDSIKTKLELLCTLLAKFGGFRIISDFLLDTIIRDNEARKEAIFLLNEAVLGLEYNEANNSLIKTIINTYTDSTYWNLPMSVMKDEFGKEHSLGEVQQNVIVVCFLVEGIGKIALTLKDKFNEYLLKVLYLVLERAGNEHPLVRAAGITALTNISVACNYSDITELITKNIDYFTYQVERKLNRMEDNVAVLNVLAVVFKYSQMSILQSITDLINEVLMQSCDKFKRKHATAFLNIFKIFLKSLIKWTKTEVKHEPLKSRIEKENATEDFKVSGIDDNQDFSDNIMGKSAEELYKEDMEKKQDDVEKEIQEPEGEEYKKPDLPLHIKLTVAILSRSSHFLPSKNRIRKLLVLEMLNDGLEIIRDWEDELLPIVHQIWSPLVVRFNEFDDPLVIKCSFKLLITLARLSKDFIRFRTTKEVLPTVLICLKKLSKLSYLKDIGAGYRYNQSYKLQLSLLNNLTRVLADLDVSEADMAKSMETVLIYLSNKQPLPLQTSALGFFKTLGKYDPKLVQEKVNSWGEESKRQEYETNLTQLRIEILQ